MKTISVEKVFGGALSSLPFFFGGIKDKVANAVPSVAVDDTDTAADAKPILWWDGNGEQ